jgi:hypothetical protein
MIAAYRRPRQAVRQQQPFERDERVFRSLIDQYSVSRELATMMPNGSSMAPSVLFSMSRSRPCAAR